MSATTRDGNDSRTYCSRNSYTLNKHDTKNIPGNVHDPVSETFSLKRITRHFRQLSGHFRMWSRIESVLQTMHKSYKPTEMAGSMRVFMNIRVLEGAHPLPASAVDVQTGTLAEALEVRASFTNNNFCSRTCRPDGKATTFSGMFMNTSAAVLLGVGTTLNLYFWPVRDINWITLVSFSAFINHTRIYFS